jgi:dihydrofolate reductase
MEPSHDTPRFATAPSAPGAPPLAIIAAVAANGVIGDANRLPWRLSEDLQRFRALTTGHAVIMGRRTWASLGRPLPGRQNIVVSRRRDASFPEVETATSLDEALARVRMPAPAFCIGGGELYREALPRAALMYLTEIARPFSGDTHFPSFERSQWRETQRDTRTHPGPDGFDYAFVTYERVAR